MGAMTTRPRHDATSTASGPVSEAGSRQRDHYEAIHSAYERTYFDAESMAYRERFIYDPLFEGLTLDGCDVAELACGSGFNSLALRRRFPLARVRGFDVSSQACASYRELVQAPAYQCDLTLPLETDASVDCAFIIGGLHHCVRNLPQVLANAARLVRKGGTLLMVEPNAEYLLEGLRRLWYRADRRYFDADTEHALAHDHLVELAGSGFSPERVRFLGGPGYFLVLNSLLFRIPPRVKAMVARPLMSADHAYNQLPGRALFPYFVARWRRL
jgi:SAM-dependent methyltransferase